MFVFPRKKRFMMSLFAKRSDLGETPTWGVTILVTSVLGLVGILLLGTLSTLASGWAVDTSINVAWRFWSVWLIAAPIVAQVNFRYPIAAPHSARRLTYLAILAVAVIGMNQWIPGRLVAQLPPLAVAPSFPPGLRGRFNQPSAPLQDPAARRRGVRHRQSRTELRFALIRGSMDALIYLALCGSCQAWAWSQRARERERRAIAAESELTRAQLAALQMQINPHFLFNSLNGIASLIHTDPETADSVLVDLSDLLRDVLERTDETESSLAQELQFIERYLAIERARFGSRLTVEIELQESTSSARVPTFILQPLVENAIRHGIERSKDRGTVQIRSRRDGAELLLSVEDNDPGPSRLESEPESGHGLGLTNTRARLKVLYQDEATLELHPLQPNGTRAVITLPFQTVRQDT